MALAMFPGGISYINCDILAVKSHRHQEWWRQKYLTAWNAYIEYIVSKKSHIS